MEELKEQLNKLIEEKGISSDEVLKLSRIVDKLINDYYKSNASGLAPANP
ncbi:MAG: aspartyl-phosphate phosphatase Spo0E family protein [Bacillota bacterium]|nr:aspartyl-phosphate phosphatase Spo0E family protein [Bacillota bacterium]